VLAPESVVVIGASRERGTVGRAILDNIRTAGYAGRLYVVNPRAGKSAASTACPRSSTCPLTDIDADQLIGSIRSAPLLRGYRGQPGADLGALRDLLLRVSRLADDLPEVPNST
jgi:acyl-CoA synthetase (NDP forming)